MKPSALLTISILLAGCATNSGVVPMGQDSYRVARQGSTAWHSLTTITSETMKEAGDYCLNQGKAVEVITTRERAAGMGVFPESEVQFRCVARKL